MAAADGQACAGLSRADDHAGHPDPGTESADRLSGVGDDDLEPIVRAAEGAIARGSAAAAALRILLTGADLNDLAL